jgi:hypothetical protein
MQIKSVLHEVFSLGNRLLIHRVYFSYGKQGPGKLVQPGSSSSYHVLPVDSLFDVHKGTFQTASIEAEHPDFKSAVEFTYRSFFLHGVVCEHDMNGERFLHVW